LDKAGQKGTTPSVMVRPEKPPSALEGPSVSDSESLLVFQAKLWALLDRRVALYTSGESSSIPQLTAYELLESVLYVLGVDPDDMDQAELARLARSDLTAEFEQGLARTKEKAEESARLWKEVCLTAPLLKSVALKDTLNALDAFIATYDYRYFAVKAECDIDYPLCNPVPEAYQGIDFINEYLARLLLENAFMGYFDLDRIKALMKSVSPDYRLLIINLFEPVATNAIGLALVDGMIPGLNVTEGQRQQIAQEFVGLSGIQARERLASAVERLCRSLRITDPALQGYLEELTAKLSPRIKAVSRFGGLAGVFLSF